MEAWAQSTRISDRRCCRNVDAARGMAATRPDRDRGGSCGRTALSTASTGDRFGKPRTWARRLHVVLPAAQVGRHAAVEHVHADLLELVDALGERAPSRRSRARRPTA